MHISRNKTLLNLKAYNCNLVLQKFQQERQGLGLSLAPWALQQAIESMLFVFMLPKGFDTRKSFETSTAVLLAVSPSVNRSCELNLTGGWTKI